MFNKLLIATVLSVGLGSAALAQNNEGEGTPNAGDQAGSIGENMPESWDGAIGDAFFSDDDMTMRSQDEITTNWGGLSAEQQAQVRLDCENMSAMNDTGAKVDETQTSATTTATGSSAGGGTDGAASSESNQTMSQVCDWVATQ